MAVTWRDDAVVLAKRPHGETHAVVSLLTRERGRHLGLVHGGGGRRRAAEAEPGNRVEATWRARLADQLGSYALEVTAQPAAALFDDPPRLAGLAAACALVDACAPEREPSPALFTRMTAFVDTLAAREDWPAVYVLFELALLHDLGFGLDLSACAVTGDEDGLAYVSPRTGRAVSEAGAGAYADRLLPLPGFLLGRGEADDEAALDGLRLTGHFLRRHVFEPLDRDPPDARARLSDLLARRVGASPPADTAPSP